MGFVEAKNFDVNIRDPENITCLHWAAINNRVPLVE
jgi:ankyrin repeat protein